MPCFWRSSIAASLSKPFSPKKVGAEPEAKTLLQEAAKKQGEDPSVIQADQTPTTEATVSPHGLSPLFAAAALGTVVTDSDSADDGSSPRSPLAAAAAEQPPLEECNERVQPQSQQQKDAATMTAEEEEELQKRIVKLHVYHTDPFTAFLNHAGLKYADVPIYHVGVEIYGTEWAFTYFDDCWDNPHLTGVWPAQVPTQMEGFDYQETILMGPTALNRQDALRVVEKLRTQWPSSSYHLTRHNCLTFARELVEKLGVSEPFPQMLVGFGNCPEYMPTTDALVNFGWAWYKWNMQRGVAAAAGDPMPALPNTWLTSCCATPQIS